MIHIILWAGLTKERRIIMEEDWLHGLFLEKVLWFKLVQAGEWLHDAYAYI